MATPKVEDYLKAIHDLQGEHSSAAPSAIAAALGVTPPSVTRMLNRLHNDELVVYEKYRGATLTDRGERLARAVLRRHRLLELFLTEELGYDWAAVHEEADVLEHYISEKLEARIAAMLDDPTTDPHGAPIPTSNLEFPTNADGCFLTECDEGDVKVVREVHESSADVLTYLADIGIVPGAVIRVTEVAPIGMVTVRIRETEGAIPLPDEIAAMIRVASFDNEHVEESKLAHEVS